MWFNKSGRLYASPGVIAQSLHRHFAEEDDPRAAPETFHLPDAVCARFREKVFVYREANILLTLVNQVKPSRDGASEDPLFDPVLREYERLIFAETAEISVADRRHSLVTAMQDLSARTHPDEAAIADIIEDNRQLVWTIVWSRNWFADISHDETNPTTLVQLFAYWSDVNTALQKVLAMMVLKPVPGVRGLIGRAIGRGYAEPLSDTSLEQKYDPAEPAVLG